MKTSEQIDEIAKALSEMQGSMGPAKKDKINPFFKSQYADLSSIWEAIRGPLVENGLCVVQDAVTLPEGVSVVTRVIHTSGEWIEFGPLIVPLAKNDAQAVGSAISYAKRYGIGAALGVVGENDDDGNRASKAAPKENPKPTSPPPKKVDMDDWYIGMEEFYPAQEVRDYVKESSAIMKKDEQYVINYLATLNPKKFNDSFERWQKQRSDKDYAPNNESVDTKA